MAKTKRVFIFGACISSLVAAVLAVVSIATEHWVESDVKGPPQLGNDFNTLKFGLFSGVFFQRVPVIGTTELTMTCLLQENVCALMCGSDMSSDLEKIHNGQFSNITFSDQCIRPATSYDVDLIRNYAHNWNRDATKKEITFINAAVRGLTIFSLTMSIVFGAISAGIAFINVASNPYQNYLSLFSLYFYNAAAAAGSLLTLALWGGLFAAKIRQNNIPMNATILDSFDTKNLSELGYSYWLNIASLSLYLLSICVLYVRQYLIAQEPEVNVHLEDDKDPNRHLLRGRGTTAPCRVK